MSWAPFFHPSGEYVLFVSNKLGFDNFEMFMVDAMGRARARPGHLHQEVRRASHVLAGRQDDRLDLQSHRLRHEPDVHRIVGPRGGRWPRLEEGPEANRRTPDCPMKIVLPCLVLRIVSSRFGVRRGSPRSRPTTPFPP